MTDETLENFIKGLQNIMDLEFMILPRTIKITETKKYLKVILASDQSEPKLLCLIEKETGTVFKATKSGKNRGEILGSINDENNGLTRATAYGFR